ncbi:MAG TPA: transglycosylase SLT domain-containing protein [Trebonia sp.]
MRRKRTPDSQPGLLAGQHLGSARKRVNFVIPAAAIAAVVVGGVSVGAYCINPSGRGAASLSQAIDSLPKSNSVVLLEQERQQIIVMHVALTTLTTTSKPAAVLPAKVVAAMTASESPSSSSGSSSSSSSDSSSSSSSSSAETMLPVDPARDQATAQSLMPGYGFSVSSQWSCLDDLWQQESSWNYTAENAQSGAYGIAQALPASKMASVASDYLTDPTTQIKWGLGYISAAYGTPCAAWDHEEADGFY